MCYSIYDKYGTQLEIIFQNFSFIQILEFSEINKKLRKYFDTPISPTEKSSG